MMDSSSYDYLKLLLGFLAGWFLKDLIFYILRRIKTFRAQRRDRHRKALIKHLR